MKKKYLACYDYGQGGLWLVFLAEEPSDISRMYPFLTPFPERPEFLSEHDIMRIEGRGLFDIDEEPHGLLKGILKELGLQ